MAVYQAKMERKQGFLFRTVDIVMELFAMSAAVSHAKSLATAGGPDSEKAMALADLFCRNSSRKVQRLFRDLWHHDDDRKNVLTGRIMDGEFSWLEEGRLDVGLTPESFKTRFLTQETEEPRKAAGL
jgi:hypothetical protein